MNHEQKKDEIREYRVIIKPDPETDQLVAEIPALRIADYGKDLPEALTRLQQMLKFHLECLKEEGQNFPAEQTDQEGTYLKVKIPAHGALTA